MSDGIYVALSGAVGQATVLETTATNLANASTDGYQRLRPVFREVLAQATTKTGAMHFSAVMGTANDTASGFARKTDRPLDLVLPNGTYLAVQTKNGERYTRACSLAVAADGSLKTSHGDLVLGEDGKPIKVAPDAEVTIDKDGAVLADGDPKGHLRLVRFTTPSALTHEGATTLASNASSGTATIAKGPLEIGSLEESNAQVVTAMTDLVSATRAFDAFQRAIDAFREADRRVVSTVPGVS